MRGKNYPGVSVIMPVLNEESHLCDSIKAVLAQNYPGELEIILAIGPSTDNTWQIAEELAETNPLLKVYQNPSGTTPDGLNLAISKTKHDIVVRVDAHGQLCPNYIQIAVDTLEKTGAANVGGLMDAQGRTAFEKAVARAYNSPLGLGGGAFHLKHTPQGPAETVFLGVFQKSALEAIGGFDPSLLRAQDWDLNHRLIQAGYQVWFNPKLSVVYRPRSTLKALAKQFFRTGQWRREVIRRNSKTIRVRYLAPPVMVLCVLIGLVVMFGGFATGRKMLARLGAVPIASYLTGVSVGAGLVGKGLPLKSRLWLPVVLSVMHFCWGSGFLIGLPKQKRTG